MTFFDFDHLDFNSTHHQLHFLGSLILFLFILFGLKALGVATKRRFVISLCFVIFLGFYKEFNWDFFYGPDDAAAGLLGVLVGLGIGVMHRLFLPFFYPRRKDRHRHHS